MAVKLMYVGKDDEPIETTITDQDTLDAIIEIFENTGTNYIVDHDLTGYIGVTA